MFKDGVINLSFLDGKISDTSDAGIGFYIHKCSVYNAIEIGLFFGRFLLTFNRVRGFKYCNFFAEGGGG